MKTGNKISNDLLLRIGVKALFDQTYDPVIIFNAAGQVQHINPAVTRLAGYEKKDLIGKNFKTMGVLASDSLPTAKKYFFAAIKGRQVPPHELTIIARNKKPITGITNIVALRHDGKNIGSVILFHDISDRIGLIKQLAISERTYREIFNNSPDVIFVHDAKNGKIIDVNKKTLDVFGYGLNEIKKKNVGQLSINEPPYTQKEALQWIRRAAQGKPQTFEWLAKNKKGQLIWFENTLTVANIAGQKRILVFGRDINERKKIKDKLKESERRHVTLLDNLPGMAYRCRNDRDWTIEYVSTGCLKLTGYHQNELLKNKKTSYANLILREDRSAVWSSVQAAIRQGKQFEITYHIRDRAGKIKWVWEKGQVVNNKTGGQAILEGFVTDITELKRLQAYEQEAATKLARREERRIGQERLEQAAFALARTEAELSKQKEIDRMKDEFITIASHQLRTPLTSVSWYLESLLDEAQGKLSGAQKKYLELAQYGSQRLTALLNDLLNVSRLEAGRVKIVARRRDLEEEIKTQIKDAKVMNSNKKCAIRFVKRGKPKSILAIDRVLFRQTFSNLLNNAIKFSPKNRCEITITLSKDNKLGHVISIADRGMGIAKKDQSKIFGRFYRAQNAIKKSPGGTGLGLYIAKRVTEAWGGRIWFSSRIGKGTTFKFSIPNKGMKSRKGEVSLV